MRLFIAIDFDASVQNRLEEAQTRLREKCATGNFTRRENLHLTLVFLGETDPSRLPELRRIIEQTESPSFSIEFERMGRFARRGGDIYFAGARRCQALSTLYQSLAARLRAAGYPIEEREYVPHITLAREAVLQRGVSTQEAERIPVHIHAQAEEIALMKSERIRGRLVYTKVCVKKLGK